MSKNIEKCKGEDALSEIVAVTSDDAKLNGLVSNDVADMYQRASGLRPLKPIDTYESPIVELKANLKLIFRRLFSVPLTMLGSNKASNPISIISMMEQMFNHYRERLKGSETYGIPSRLSQLTDLPSAPLLVSDRKISGVPEAEDGMSMARILCDSAYAATITELTDDNTGWTMVRSIASFFPNAVKMQWGCKYMRADRANFFNNLSNLEELDFTDCELISGDWSYGSGSNHKIIGNNNALEKFKTPSLKELRSTTSWSQCPLLVDNPVLEEWYSPKFEKTNCSYMVHNCPNLQRVVFGKLIADFVSAYGSYGENFTGSNSKMVHFEIGAGTAVSLHLNWWNPSYILSDNPTGTDLIEEGSTAQNNLQQFLQNMRQYIMLRLAQRTSTTSLTLTLSPAVYKAVYGLDANYNVDPNALAQTASLADFGITTEDLNEIEIAAGITTATKYATWLDTYRGAIYWNVQYS